MASLLDQPSRQHEAGQLVRYAVYERSAFGHFGLVAEFEAGGDRAALPHAHHIVPHGTGELRQGMRIICRFGRCS
jgi:hypothetical protein